MTKQEALNKLGLKEDFTDKEFKAAYLKLAREHHPDIFMNASEEVRLFHQEEMKGINDARDYLKKVNFDVVSYRKSILNQMSDYLWEIKDVPDDLKNAVESILDECKTQLNGRDSKASLDEILKRFKERLKDIYVFYKNSFYRDNLIASEDVVETVNYDARVKVFYEQMLTIKKKYGKCLKIEEKGFGYKLWTDNECLKKLIDVAVDNAKKRFRQGNTLEQVLEIMDKEIKDTFGMYYSLETKVKKLRDMAISVETLNRTKDIYVDLKNGGSALCDIEMALEKLEQDILKELALDKQKVEMNKIYASLIKKASERLQELNPERDMLFMSVQANIMRISNIFSFVYQNLINVELLQELEKLTFKEMDLDNNILGLVEASLLVGENTQKQIENILYVRKNNLEDYNDRWSIYMVEEFGDICKLVKWYGGFILDYKEVTMEQLQRDFEPLDDYLTFSNLQWKQDNWNWDCRRSLLYSFGINRQAFLVVIEERDFSTEKIDIMSNSDVSCLNFCNIPDNTKDKWKDPEIIKQAIIERINELKQMSINKLR